MLANSQAGAPLRDAQPASDESTESTVAEQISQARAAVSLGLYVSATRCVLQYVVAPAFGALGALAGGLGLVLQMLGTVTSVAGAVRLRRLGSRWWPTYAALAVAITVLTITILLRSIVGQVAP